MAPLHDLLDAMEARAARLERQASGFVIAKATDLAPTATLASIGLRATIHLLKEHEAALERRRNYGRKS